LDAGIQDVSTRIRVLLKYKNISKEVQNDEKLLEYDEK